MADKINPLTGLAYTREESSRINPPENPLTGKAYTTEETARFNPASAPAAGLKTGQLQGGLADYKKYGVSLSRFADHEEDRARYQSRSEKWGRGLMKAGVTAVGAVADGTLGLLSGIGEAAYHQDFSYFYNNSVGKQVDKINNWMGENYANYYTEAERNAEGLASLGYANFWADKAMNGIGYAVGAIATVYATGGAGLLTRGLGTASKGLRAYKASKMVAQGSSKVQAARSVLNNAARTNKVLNGVQTLEIGAMMSAGEANVEAREALHRTTDRLKQMRAEELGINVNELTATDLKEIHDEASAAANTVFGLNMAVLSATNVVGFGRHLLPKYTNMRAGMKGITRDAKTGKFKDFWKEKPFWGGVADRYLKNPVRDGLSEAVQESSQFLFQEGADKVIEKSGGNIIEDWTEAMMESYGDIYGTKEGKESAMLGFIVGALMGGFGSVKQFAQSKEVDKNRAKVLESLNDPAFTKVLTQAQAFKEQQMSAEEMQAALERGDHKAFRDAQDALIRQEIAMHYQNGTLDLYMERLDDAQAMEDGEFREAYGIPKDVEFDKNKTISGIKDKVRKYEDLRNRVETAFTTRPKSGIDRALMSKEAKQEEEEMLADEAMLRQKILMHGLEIEDVDGRIDSLIEEINEMHNKSAYKSQEKTLSKEDFSEIGPVAEIVEYGEDGTVTQTGGGNITAEAAVKLQQIQDAISAANGIEGAEAREKIADLKRLVRDRKNTVGAIAELAGRPEERSTAIARMKQKEAVKMQGRRQSAIRERMNDTNTYKELQDLVAEVNDEQGVPFSKEFVKEVNDEVERRLQTETDMMSEMSYEHLEKLKSELGKEEDPVRKAVLKQHIEEREARGQVEGLPRPEKTKAQATGDRKSRRDEINRKTAEAKANEAAKHEQNQGDPIAPVKDENEQSKVKGPVLTAANGRLARNEDGTTTVENGQVKRGNHDTILAGTNQEIDYEAQREVTQNDKVDLTHLGLNEAGMPVVGIFKDGKLVGVLNGEGVKGSGLLVEGETKPAVVLRRFDNNPIQVQEMGDVQFLTENENFVGFAVRRNDRFDMGPETSEDAQAAVAELNEPKRFSKYDKKIAPGQIVAIVRAPNGELKPLLVSTKQLGEQGAKDLMAAVFENQELSLVRQKFGVTNQATPETEFIIEQIGEQLIVSWKVGDNLVSFNATELRKLYNSEGKDGAFTIGKFEAVDVEGQEEKEYAFQKLKEDPTTDLNRDEFRAQALAALKEMLPGMRFQIDKKLLSEPGYIKDVVVPRLQADFIALPNGELFSDPLIEVMATEAVSEEEIVEQVGQVVEEKEPAAVVKEAEVVELESDEEFDDFFLEEDGPAEQQPLDPDGEVVSESEFQFAPEDDSGATRLAPKARRKINKAKATKFLKDRFGEDSVVIFDQLETIGNAVVHGYVQNGAAHLWNNAEVGTEYHEAFHLLFRSNMNEAQREALYQSALERYGEPTAAEIDAARRGQPNMSTKEARLLALEEKMAEEFRDFMMNEEEVKRTLPQRIAKFFSDILAYIKAVINGKVTVDQAFSLLQNNRIPKSYTRNATKFAPGPAFMLKQYAANPQMHKELIDISIYKVLNAMQESKASAEDLLGNAALEQSALRDWFLKSAFNRYGQPLNRQQFIELKEAIKAGNPKPVLKKYGITPGAPITDEYGNAYPEKVAGSVDAARKFYNVYKNWFDQVGEQGETIVRGFRSEISDRLKEYGLNLRDNSLEDADAAFERIFSLSRLQEDPAKKLSEKAKRVLSRIPVTNLEESVFGFQTYVPINEVFTKIGISVAGSTSLTDMLSKLEAKSKGNAELRAVYEFINNLGAQEKALFYSNMAQSVSEFRMVKIESDADGNRVVKILDPGVGSISTEMFKKWYTKATSTGGLYTMDMSEEGEITFSIDQNKKRKAVAKLQMALQERIAPTDANFNALANGLWDLGIELGATREQAVARVKQTFAGQGNKYDQFLNSADIAYLVDSLNRNQNIYTDADSKIKEIANVISANFESPTNASFVDAFGRDIFALNQKTDLDITAELIQSGEYGRMMEDKVGHQAGDVKTLATLLLTEGRNKYGQDFVPITFSAFRQEIDPDKPETSDYESMTFREALSVSLNMFNNKTNPKINYIALDTQADRSRLVYVPVPNWLDGRNDVDYPYGLNQVFAEAGGNKDKRTRELLKRQILVDLHRISKDRVYTIPIEGYHTEGRFRFMQTGGRLDPSMDHIADAARKFVETDGAVMPQELTDFINSTIEEVYAKLEADKQALVEEFGGEQGLIDFVVQNTNIPAERASVFVSDFLTADMMGRMMTRQIFRSGVNYVKNGADYNKRAGLTTTPGVQLMQQGEVPSEPDYGMPKEFRELTVADIKIPVDQVESFREKLTEQVGAEAADKIIQDLSNVNTTDAQAFITPAFYRNIRQGLGLWTEADQARYEKDGSVKAYPLKPSYEYRVEHEGHLVPVSHKNSYIVLTRDLVQGIPALEQLLNRMEAVGDFADMQGVDVVNTESAKKLGSFVPVDGTSKEALMSAPVMSVPSAGLKFPQMIPESFKDMITFGRQPRKNMIANIKDNNKYLFRGKPISGKELKQFYHKSLVAKLELNKQRVFSELGYDKVLEAETPQDFYRAIDNMLPKLRDKMKALGVEKDYPQNFLDSLEIVKDANGKLTTRLPLSFPSIHSKLDQLLLGMFRTEVYKQKLPGQELVQFSEYAAGEDTGKLKFYTIEGQRIVEAEVDVPGEVLEAMGVDLNLPIEEINKEVERILGYRIPQQGKASMMVMKIRNILPKGTSKAIRVPTGTTAMMGSDFDVDKMFVVFPELEKGKRVQFDMNQDPSTMTEKQLNNVILETFAAVGTNTVHLGEILGGVEIVDIEKAREELGLSKPNIDINSPVQRLQSGLDNMLSGRLRGIYANGIAGRNVVEASGVKFTGEVDVKIDGQVLNTVVDKSPFNGKYTDQHMSQYLSAAVDSVKDPLQAQINDNAVTAPLTLYMLSIGMTPTQAIGFLTHPSIKAVTEQARLSGSSIIEVLNQKKIKPVGVIELDPKGRPGLQAEAMLASMAREARALANLYSLVTPDAIDKAGTTAQHLALLDKAEGLEGVTFGGPAALREITQGEAYPIAKAYYQAIRQSLDVGRRVGFIGAQPAVQSFKNELKQVLGVQNLNEQQHRDINRAILHHLVTQEGSPLFESGLLDADYVSVMFFAGGFAEALNEAKEENGNNVNRVLDSIKLSEPELMDNGAQMVRIEIDKSQIKTKLDKDMWTATYLGMMNNPKYKPLLDALVMSSVVSNGFAPGPNTVFDLIPVEQFEKLGVAAHLNQQMAQLEDVNGQTKLRVQFMDTFIANYGTHSVGRKNFLTHKRAVHLPQYANVKLKAKFVVLVDNGKKKIYRKQESGVYRPTVTKGLQYKFYEANLRDPRTGMKYTGSLLTHESAAKVDTAGAVNQSRLEGGQKETFVNAEQKVERLKAAFAAAGVDVVVEMGELPPGVKGQVEGNIVTLDPNQMTEDTVYHEFGHILVDMLPEAEVKKYIQQVVKANPALARAVKARYPELEGVQLGKEILVTAIGMEGARIERKNPSKLQRLVNKILRAIGKVFGIEPNAAAMLAEQMFGAEIKAELLVNQISPAVQRSVDLQTDIDNVTKDVLKSLTRQKIRLESIPQSEYTEERLTEIKLLENRMGEIRDRQGDITNFLQFQQYVVARVERLESLMDEVYAKKDMPMSREEKLELLQQMAEIKETLDSLYNTNAKRSTINKVKKLMLRMDFAEAQSETVTDVYLDLENALSRLELLEEEYADVALPVLADTLLTYADTGIADKVDELIEQVRKNKDISGFSAKAFLTRDPEFLALRRKKKAGELTDAEYTDALVELKVEHLRKKRPGREQLIQEMRDAHKSKNGFSFLMDPLVYSREGNVQLFGLAIKDALNNATELSRDFLFELEAQYDKFKDFQGSDFNEARFNEDLLTTVTIGDMKVLALVQKYDTEKFRDARETFMKAAALKHGRPTEQSEISEWYQTPEGRAYSAEVNAWYKQNTEKAPRADEIYAELMEKIGKLQYAINNETNLDKIGLMEVELKDLQRKASNSYDQYTDTWKGDLAVPLESKYTSEKWEKIQATPELKEYYDFIVTKFHEAQAKIGKSSMYVDPWNTYSYIMPSVRRDKLATMQQEGWKEIGTEIKAEFQREDTDTEFGVMTTADGESLDSIPRFYTNQVEASKVSRDVAASLAQFTHMANMFQEKGKVVGLVEAMMHAHENREVLTIDESTGNRVINEVTRRALGEIEYATTDPKGSYTYKHLKEFIDSVFYGRVDLDQGTYMGVNVTKAAGKAAGLTAVANLAFNTLQAGNQFILDNAMGIEEALAGQFFSGSDLAWAAGMYASQKGALGDLGAFVPKSKLGQAMQMFDALNEVTDSMGKGVTGSKLKKAVQADPFFVLQHGIEHQTVGVRMLALLRSYKGKLKDADGNVLLNEEGQEADLWDMLVKDEKGKYMIDPRVANVNKNQIIAKIHGVNKRTNQIKGSFDRSMGSRRALGKLLLLFRNYLIPGLRKRFGHGDPYHVDYELGEVTRGMYLSFGSYLRSAVTTGSPVSAFQMMSETDKQNVKRTAFEAMLTAATAVIYSTLNAMLDDEDEEDNYLAAFGAYQARRLQMELMQFVNPAEAFNMLQSPMATVNWMEKYLNIVDQAFLKLPGYAVGLVEEDKVFYQRKTATAEKGDLKLLNTIKRVTPVLNGWQTSFLAEGGAEAVEEKMRWFD